MLRVGSPEYEALVYGLGHLTFAWSQLEYGLDHCIGAVYMQHDGTKFEKKSPSALKGKLKFLRKAFTVAPTLADYKAEMLVLLDQVEPALEFRNGMIHGVAHPNLTAEGGIFMVRLLRAPNGLPKKSFEVRLETLQQEGDRAQLLANEALRLAHVLFGIVSDRT